MLKKLELDTLKAELASINHLLSQKNIANDPISSRQFDSRKKRLCDKIKEIGEQPRNFAEVGLFFGGKPVFGSKGVDVEFATSLVEKYQNILSKRYSFLESGTLASRGPVPNSDNAKMMITDVARGSFGFVLEESPYNNEALVDSVLKYVVEDVGDILDKISSSEEQLFDEVIEKIDERTLGDVRQFFNELSSYEATLKIIDSKNEYLFSRERIQKAKERTDYVRISEDRTIQISGRLYIFPKDKRFELQPDDSTDVIKGIITKSFLDKNIEKIDYLLGKKLMVSLLVRDIYNKEVVVKSKYMLDDAII